MNRDHQTAPSAETWRVEHDRTAVEARHQQALETAIAGCIEKAAAEREQWRNEFHRQRERIATLEADLARVTQERDEARKKCADNERGYESLIRRYEHSVSAETARADAAEARCATLQGAVAADEERLRQAAARAGVLFVGCDTADALADRCATLTAALERLRDCDWTIGRGDRMDPVRDIARNALSGVPTP